MTDTASPPTTDVTWEAPGPGSWLADRSHGLPNSTRTWRRIAADLTKEAYRQPMRDFGSPLETVDMQFVHGQIFRRLIPLVGAKFDTGKPPPAPVLKILMRLLPVFRREERQARHTLEHKTYLNEIRRWHEGDRDVWEARNRTTQAIDPGALDDNALADHLDDLNTFLAEGWFRHHELHAFDLGPIGDLIAHAREWGIDTVATMSLLKGASPATVAAAEHTRAIADALHEGGVDPSGINDIAAIRAVPAANAALDTYLESFGWRIIIGYDFDGATLHEMPSAICAGVRAAAAGPMPEPDQASIQAELRSQCPEPELFDELVADARSAYGVRDDNGPLTWAWPAGLARRGFLEAGRRLHAADRIADIEHAFELDLPELSAMLRDPASGPSANDITKRAQHRVWEGTLVSPDYLGAPPVIPDLSPFPPSLKRIMGIIVTASTLLEVDPDADHGALDGVGVGTGTYQGRACLVDNAAEAIDRLEPGDVLVTPFTAPSFNAIIPIAGAIVVQEGGLLCHAAVLARELGMPAVVGVSAAMTAIKDGDDVIVDPAAGTVRVL